MRKEPSAMNVEVTRTVMDLILQFELPSCKGINIDYVKRPMGIRADVQVIGWERDTWLRVYIRRGKLVGKWEAYYGVVVESGDKGLSQTILPGRSFVYIVGDDGRFGHSFSLSPLCKKLQSVFSLPKRASV